MQEDDNYRRLVLKNKEIPSERKISDGIFDFYQALVKLFLYVEGGYACEFFKLIHKMNITVIATHCGNFFNG